MRPPVSVIVARLRARVAHRLSAVDEYDRCFTKFTAQIVGRRNAGNSCTDDRYFKVVPGISYVFSAAVRVRRNACSVIREFASAFSRNS
jgi:hypothetical protein